MASSAHRTAGLCRNRAPKVIPCSVEGCSKFFRSQSGLTQHLRWHAKRRAEEQHNNFPSSPIHAPEPIYNDDDLFNPDDRMFSDGDNKSDSFSDSESRATVITLELTAKPDPDPDSAFSAADSDEDVEIETDTETVSDAGASKHFHPTLMVWTPCTAEGAPLPPNVPPPPRNVRPNNDWTPFESRSAFETADLLFRRVQMPQERIDDLMNIWNQTGSAPFADHKAMLTTIDSSPLGGVPWQSISISYQGTKPAADIPQWMDDENTVWFRDPRELVKNIVDNPDYEGEFDYAAYHEYDDSDERRYKDFMSDDWAWRQSDIIAEDPKTKGAVFVPVILGSDKTMVSVATGQNEYYPLYLSIGNIHNTTRRAHRDGVVLVGFLAIPKTDKEHANSTAFRKYRRQLFHSSLSYILQSLRHDDPRGLALSRRPLLARNLRAWPIHSGLSGASSACLHCQ
ncbi:hypothetical protein HGRIS_001256 [Hohenbuehelia grisea]|uniref:C2H2-type domain-containing protein n=1 Tax=Hohenbuehelia grisea TaxID=104357 RepID=A0ABR3JPC9_9AGAR